MMICSWQIQPFVHSSILRALQVGSSLARLRGGAQRHHHPLLKTIASPMNISFH
jgi:hypothetical protein